MSSLRRTNSRGYNLSALSEQKNSHRKNMIDSSINSDIIVFILVVEITK